MQSTPCGGGGGEEPFQPSKQSQMLRASAFKHANAELSASGCFSPSLGTLAEVSTYRYDKKKDRRAQISKLFLRYEMLSLSEKQDLKLCVHTT